jgi:SAM-dependent methyltransferase
MKLIQYVYYFFRSIWFRGPINTFKLLTFEGKYEKRLGIKTHSIVNLDKLTLAGVASVENHHYQGASYYILFKVFNLLPTQLKSKPLIDYGCGKGRALFVAEQCGFTNLIGVDIAKELIEDAKANQLIYSKMYKESKFSFLFEDATKYIIPNDADTFYFFNPFGEYIIQLVINNIKESIKQNPRTIYCIYLNPKYKEVFETNGFKEFTTIKSWRYVEGIIYKLN